MQQLFSYFDKHSKGYLTQQDWIQQFKQFDKQGLIYQQFVNSLVYNFSSIEECFEYFTKLSSSSEQQQIDKNTLEKGIKKLLPQRYSQKDLNQLYQILNEGQPIDRKTFFSRLDRLFGNSFNRSTCRSQQTNNHNSRYSIMSHEMLNKGNSENEFYSSGKYGKSVLGFKQGVFRVSHSGNKWQNNDNSDTNRSKYHYQSLLLSNNQNDSDGLQKPMVQNDIIYKMKSIIKGDEQSMLKKFQQFDVNDSGVITNLQFKKALRPWGFNNRDIDVLFSIVE